eukprot:31152_1
MAAEEKFEAEDNDEGCCSKFATSSGLCCFMSENEYKHNPLAEVVQNDKRRCTDLACLFVLTFALISELILIWYAADHGAEPKLLMHGYDSRMLSNIPSFCDSDNSNGKFAIWPDLDYYDVRICQSSCSQTNNASNSLIIGGDIYRSSSFMSAYCLPDLSDKLPSGFDTESESYQRAISDLQT